MNSRDLLIDYWQRLGRQNWDGALALLHPEFTASYSHTGETFDRDAMHALNRDYPGTWAVAIEEALGDGDQAVARARLTDSTETYVVATFVRLRDGLITELTEVWTDSVTDPPERGAA